MSKAKKVKNNNVTNKKTYTSPTKKTWGKILIALLAASFVVAMVATVIYFIVISILQV